MELVFVRFLPKSALEALVKLNEKRKKYLLSQKPLNMIPFPVKEDFKGVV